VARRRRHVDRPLDLCGARRGDPAIRFGHRSSGGRIRLGTSSLRRLGLGESFLARVITPAITKLITPYRGRWTWVGGWELLLTFWFAEEWVQTGVSCPVGHW
jgi:hypothetical protein